MPITQWTADDLTAHLDALTDILHACVHAGASIGFILPHPRAEARAFWQNTILPAIRTGDRALFVATQNGQPVATAQLIMATPANQPHRAEVSKVLVHPDARRQGLARALMQALEAHARTHGKTLLTLDTRTGDHAEPLYRQQGFTAAGVIPGFCLDIDGRRLDSTTYMYKSLA